MAQGIQWNVTTDSGEVLGPTLDWGARGAIEILQSIRHTLTTRLKTVILFREFGTDFTFLDKPIGRAQKIIGAVSQAITKWNTRVQILDVSFGGATAQGNLIVNIKVHLLTTAEYVHRSSID